MKQLLIYIIGILLWCNSMTAAAVTYSGTLPVVFINASDSITSKENYIDATFYIDDMGCEGFSSVGSADDPLPLLIRGRGNWTWFGPFEKKAYKIKLEEGLPLLGMGKNKHFALLAHADGNNPFFRNTAGFELSRLLELDFTPEQQPVELVLNGEYQGLYFLTETVRVGKRRVNIVEQKDYETNTDSITGGWLLEIDNASDEHQLKMNVSGTTLQYWWITYHSPENLSNEQRNYLRYQMTRILAMVYNSNKTSTAWPSMLDLDNLTRFYLIHEMLDNIEAFLGSCYFFKDYKADKWKFGPVWDCGSALNQWHNKNRFIYDYDDWQPCIMEEIAKFPMFQNHVRQLWYNEAHLLYSELTDCLTAFAEYIRAAAACDYERWPNYGVADIDKMLARCLSLLKEKELFLVSQWGEYNGYSDMANVKVQLPVDNHIYNLQGQRLSSLPARGLYIQNGRKMIVKNGRRIN